MFYATEFAQDVKFEEHYIEYHFSLEHFKMLKSKQLKMLKPIESGFFAEFNKDSQKMLF